MDKIIYLNSIIEKLEDNSQFKDIFLLLQSENLITNELIDSIIKELDMLSRELLKNINEIKSFLENLKTKEISDRKREVEELIKLNIDI